MIFKLSVFSEQAQFTFIVQITTCTNIRGAPLLSDHSIMVKKSEKLLDTTRAMPSIVSLRFQNPFFFYQFQYQHLSVTTINLFDYIEFWRGTLAAPVIVKSLTLLQDDVRLFVNLVCLFRKNAGTNMSSVDVSN